MIYSSLIEDLCIYRNSKHSVVAISRRQYVFSYQIVTLIYLPHCHLYFRYQIVRIKILSY